VYAVTKKPLFGSIFERPEFTQAGLCTSPESQQSIIMSWMDGKEKVATEATLSTLVSHKKAHEGAASF
jgi:hypothetical protein